MFDKIDMGSERVKYTKSLQSTVTRTKPPNNRCEAIELTQSIMG